MDFLRNLGETFNEAIDFVVEKNKKFSKVTSLKKQIKKEANSVVKSYITLGKHYYNELRDVPNRDMQKVCDSIDSAKKEIRRLKDKLEEVKNEVNLSEFEELITRDEPIEIEVISTTKGTESADFSELGEDGDDDSGLSSGKKKDNKSKEK